MQFQLVQRGRALLDFEVTARQTAGRLQQQVEAELVAAGLGPDALPEGMDERHRTIDAVLAELKVG